MTKITPFQGQFKLVRLSESEAPVVDQDRLQEASAGRVVLETGIAAGGAGVCLFAVNPPLALVAGTAAGGVWAFGRYRSNRQVALYRSGIDQFQTFQNMIAGASTAEEINPTRADIRQQISQAEDQEIRLLCLAADVLALKTQADLYKRQLAGGIAADQVKRNLADPHPVQGLLNAVRRYAESRESKGRRQRHMERETCLHEARDLAGQLLSADWHAVERSCDQLLAERGAFERGDLVEMYYSARRLLFSKLNQLLRNHAFSAQEIMSDPFMEDDDIQF